MLSIDNDLQRACTEALDTFCCGAIVALDPRTGELLAIIPHLVTTPNILSVIPESLWLENPKRTHPLLEPTTKRLIPPGSTVKFIPIGAGLEEGMITENSTFGMQSLWSATSSVTRARNQLGTGKLAVIQEPERHVTGPIGQSY